MLDETNEELCFSFRLPTLNRSATIVLAYLMKSEDMKLQDAYDFLKSKRPEVRPNLGKCLVR